jgi:hypothetical protein
MIVLAKASSNLTERPSWYMRPGTVREPRRRATPAVRSRYQTTANEDLEDFMRAAVTVTFGAYKLSETVLVICS